MFTISDSFQIAHIFRWNGASLEEILFGHYLTGIFPTTDLFGLFAAGQGVHFQWWAHSDRVIIRQFCPSLGMRVDCPQVDLDCSTLTRAVRLRACPTVSALDSSGDPLLEYYWLQQWHCQCPSRTAPCEWGSHYLTSARKATRCFICGSHWLPNKTVHPMYIVYKCIFR